MVGGEIAKLAEELISISQQMDSADLIFDNLRMWLDLVKHRSDCLSLEVDARLKRPSCTALDRKTDISTDGHGTTDSNSSYRWPSETYNTAHSRLFPFWNTSFPTISPPPIDVRAFCPSLLIYLITQPYFKTQARLRRGCLAPISPVFITLKL